MPPSLAETHAINELATVLYDMLPGSGNPNLSFPTVAAQLDLSNYWNGGSKLPAIVQLLSMVFDQERHKFCDLVESVVRQSISWRAKRGNPLTRKEVEQINGILERLNFKIPNLHDPTFLCSLERRRLATDGQRPKDPSHLAGMKSALVELARREPTERGFAFERFLQDFFEFHGLAPRGSFRLRGEQIDGSFQHDGQTYLLEAKWQNAPVGCKDLASLHGKIASKAEWSRGLFVSYAGFSPDGLAAFQNGRPTNLIAMNGHDLHEVLEQRLDLSDVLRAKARRAAETNRCWVPVRELVLGRP